MESISNVLDTEKKCRPKSKVKCKNLIGSGPNRPMKKDKNLEKCKSWCLETSRCKSLLHGTVSVRGKRETRCYLNYEKCDVVQFRKRGPKLKLYNIADWRRFYRTALEYIQRDYTGSDSRTVNFRKIRLKTLLNPETSLDCHIFL